MADQTKVDGGDSARRFGTMGAASVVDNLADFGSDVASLAELQARLATLELKANLRRAALPPGLLTGAIVLSVASVPLALIGAAELLASALEWADRGWVYLIVAASALINAALLAKLTVKRLLRSFDGFARTRHELVRNLAWIPSSVHLSRPHGLRRLEPKIPDWVRLSIRMICKDIYLSHTD
jgi:uncharacterized membrane protein YqjE